VNLLIYLRAKVSWPGYNECTFSVSKLLCAWLWICFWLAFSGETKTFYCYSERKLLHNYSGTRTDDLWPSIRNFIKSLLAEEHKRSDNILPWTAAIFTAVLLYDFHIYRSCMNINFAFFEILVKAILYVLYSWASCWRLLSARGSVVRVCRPGFDSPAKFDQKTLKVGIHSFPAWSSAFKRVSVKIGWQVCLCPWARHLMELSLPLSG